MVISASERRARGSAVILSSSYIPGSIRTTFALLMSFLADVDAVELTSTPS
jgi:hypothetical protein